MKQKTTNAKIEGTSALVYPVRVSYLHVLEPFHPNGVTTPNDRYCAMLMLPKNNTELLNALKAAYQNAVEVGNKTKWNDKGMTASSPFRDGDDKKDENLHGHFTLNAKTKDKLTVYGTNKQPITDPAQIYSGMWVAAKINFYPYETGGSRGVAVALNAIMKMDDDEKFGGSGSEGADAFDSLGIAQAAPAVDPFAL